MKDRKKTRREKHHFGLAIAGGALFIGGLLLISSFVALPYSILVSLGVAAGIVSVALETIGIARAIARKVRIKRSISGEAKALSKIKQIENDLSLSTAEKRQAILKQQRKINKKRLKRWKATGREFPLLFRTGRIDSRLERLNIAKNTVQVSQKTGHKDLFSAKPKGTRQQKRAQKKFNKSQEKYGTDLPVYQHTWDQPSSTIYGTANVGGANRIFCQSKSTVEGFKNLVSGFSSSSKNLGSALKVNYAKSGVSPTLVQYSDKSKTKQVIDLLLNEAQEVAMATGDAVFPISIESQSKVGGLKKDKQIMVYRTIEDVQNNTPIIINGSKSKTSQQNIQEDNPFVL